MVNRIQYASLKMVVYIDKRFGIVWKKRNTCNLFLFFFHFTRHNFTIITSLKIVVCRQTIRYRWKKEKKLLIPYFLFNTYSMSQNFWDNHFKINTCFAIFMKFWQVITIIFLIICTKFHVYRIISGSIFAFYVSVYVCNCGYNLNMEKI